jgi:hypothetical protein
MQSSEYYDYLQKAGEYALKARGEPDPLTRRALEEASGEYLRRAALANTRSNECSFGLGKPGNLGDAYGLIARMRFDSHAPRARLNRPC